MIKNLVFDLGNVLLEFKPLDYLEENYSDSKMIKELYHKLFKSEEWVKLDRGILTRKEVVRKLGGQYPKLELEIEKLLSSLDTILQPKEETISLLKNLAKKNYNLYVLSNFHRRAYQEVVSKYDFFDYFDGVVISAKINSIKPETKSYEYLLAKYELNPEKTIFIDDQYQNLAGAQEFGIKTIHFHDDIPNLKRKLVEFGIL